MLLKDQLRQIAKSLMATDLWLTIKQRPYIQRYTQVSKYWQIQIQRYNKGELTKYSLLPKQNLQTDKIIWQYWGQGVDNNKLPDIVRLCFASVDKHRGEYRVIRLSDETIKDYIDLPDFVQSRISARGVWGGGYTRTVFSDLLRTALLATYGGVWLDATVLLTRPFDSIYTESDFFMFQRSMDEPHKNYWRSSYYAYWGWQPEFKVKHLNSIIFAQRDSKVIKALLDLLLHYWKTQDKVIDYFIYQVLITELINNGLVGDNCPIISDVIPHIIHTRVNGGIYPGISNAEVLRKCGIHKMTYFTPEAFDRLKNILRSEGIEI